MSPVVRHRFEIAGPQVHVSTRESPSVADSKTIGLPVASSAALIFVYRPWALASTVLPGTLESGTLHQSYLRKSTPQSAKSCASTASWLRLPARPWQVAVP